MNYSLILIILILNLITNLILKGGGFLRDKNEDFYDDKKMEKNIKLAKKLVKKLIKKKKSNKYHSDDIKTKLDLKEANYPAFKLNRPLFIN